MHVYLLFFFFFILHKLLFLPLTLTYRYLLQIRRLKQEATKRQSLLVTPHQLRRQSHVPHDTIFSPIHHRCKQQTSVPPPPRFATPIVAARATARKTTPHSVTDSVARTSSVQPASAQNEPVAEITEGVRAMQLDSPYHIEEKLEEQKKTDDVERVFSTIFSRLNVPGKTKYSSPGPLHEHWLKVCLVIINFISHSAYQPIYLWGRLLSLISLDSELIW